MTGTKTVNLTQGSPDQQQRIIFHLNHEEYAVDAHQVQEIVELSHITKVPHLPDFIRGVINLRGIIIPVIDLKMKFGMHSEEYKKHTCVIITEFSGGVMGLIVDAVSDVLQMAEGSIASPPSFGERVRTDFIKGMGNINNRLVIVLDVDRVLSQEETSLLPTEAHIMGDESDRSVIPDLPAAEENY
jgi:purine-binding chemotaxis protein CheW